MRLLDVSWERSLEINDWITDAARPGVFSTYISRDEEKRLCRVYLLSHPDTAMEFKMRWM